MSSSSKASCNKLPEHLLELIVEKLCHKGWSPDLLNLRLVSKAWRDAVAKYGAEIHLNLQQATDILNVCKSFGGLRQLLVSSPNIQFDLRPLQQCGGLTGLSLTNEIVDDSVDTELLVDLRLLPPSLRKLDILHCHVETSDFPLLRCTELTSLTFTWTSNTAAEVCQLLQLLPHLKVRRHASPAR